MNTGEYRKLELHERICQICIDGIEDELHFVLICPAYVIPRRLLFNKIQIENVTNLHDFDKYKLLMTNHWKHLLDYVSDAWQIRKRKLFNC